MGDRVFVATVDPWSHRIEAALAHHPGWIVLQLEARDDRGAIPWSTCDIVVAPTHMLLPAIGRVAPVRLLPYGPPDHIDRAFMAGFQDYLAVPVELIELLARADQLLRSRDAPLGHVLSHPQASVVLSGTQRSVVDVLLKFEGQVVDRSVLAQVLKVEPDSRAVDMAISRLRRSLVGFPLKIETVRRQGYRLRRP